ncbi:MAG: hypothetical protein ACI4XA_03415 [Oscillospiraceae bacterium]
MADETRTTQTTTELGGAQTAGGAASPSSDSATSTPDTAGAEKTFTQGEVDSLIKSRLERERKGQPTKDELTAFREWQNSQKTAEQKAADELKAAQDAQSAAEQKAADYEAMFAAMKAGVSAEAAEDVVALAKLKVSESMPLSAAIAEVLKKYPQFCGAPAPAAATTGARINNGGGTTVSGVEKRFLEKNPGIKI